MTMFGKKKKVDANAAAAAAPPAEVSPAEAAPAEIAAPAAPAGSGLGFDPNADAPASTGGLASGLSAKGNKPNIAASRLGGRPPAKPSAPSTPSYVPPAPVSAAHAPAAPSPGPSESNTLPAQASVHQPQSPAEAEMSRSGRMNAMKDHASTDMVGGVAGGDEKGEGKNPYKLNPLFDVILPVGMALVLCGGFASTVKVVKDKHVIYGWPKEELETVVKDKSIASEQIISDVKKMEPLKLLEAGETAQAVTAAKQMGVDNMKVAAQGEDDTAKSKAVRGLLCAGMVLCRAGNKPEKELGLTYMAKANEIATYSKFVRLLYARELARAHRDDEAIAEYKKIISLFKEPWTPAHKELGMLYMRNNQGPEAVEEFTDLIKADPADPSLQRQLGLAMGQAGDQTAGFEEFQKGFTREQDVLSYPAAVKGLVDAHGGLVDATYVDVKKAADKNPSDMKLQLDLARLEIATGKFKDARDRMEKARKVQELNPEVHEVMAEIMVRQNQATSAFDEYRSAAQNLHLQN